MCLGKTFNEKTHLYFIENTYRFYTGLIFFDMWVRVLTFILSWNNEPMSFISSFFYQKNVCEWNSFFAK